MQAMCLSFVYFVRFVREKIMVLDIFKLLSLRERERPILKLVFNFGWLLEANEQKHIDAFFFSRCK